MMRGIFCRGDSHYHMNGYFQGFQISWFGATEAKMICGLIYILWHIVQLLKH